MTRMLAVAGVVLSCFAWVNAAAQPSVEFQTYTVDVVELGTQFQVERRLQTGQLPFEVGYLVRSTSGEEIACEAVWDIDVYVDTDSDGNPANDRDFLGQECSMTLGENFNPTVRLVIEQDGHTVVTWENTPRNDFLVGDSVVLNGEALTESLGIDLTSTAVAWSQLHMEKMGFQYMTEYSSSVQNANSATATAWHAHPGKYVYELRVTDATGTDHAARITAWVVDPAFPEKTAGLTMGDIWNECYSQTEHVFLENCHNFFSDLEAAQKLDWLRLQGIDQIQIMNQVPIVETVPLPVISTLGEVHYIGPEDFAFVGGHVESLHSALQMWCFMESGSGDPTYSSWWLPVAQLSSSYLESFFSQYRTFVLSQAAVAESNHAESFTFAYGHPYLFWVLPELARTRPSQADWLCGQWIELCRDVRQAFSGPIGIGVPAQIPLARRITDEVDFLCTNVGGFEGYNELLRSASTEEELLLAYGEYAETFLCPTSEYFQKPIRLGFWPFSIGEACANGYLQDLEHDTYATWRTEFSWKDHADAILAGDTNPEYRPDFREQVRMIEAFIPAIAACNCVEGVFQEYEFWKLLDFREFRPAGILDYFNLFTGSLQGKPGFEAFRLWLSMLTPNDTLVYRRVVPAALAQTDHTSTGASPGPLASHVAETIDSARELVALPSDFVPASYSLDASYPTAETDYWTLPGHDVSSVRMLFDDTVLAIAWETHSPQLLDSPYGYSVFFWEPALASPRSALLITVSPSEREINMRNRVGQSWSDVSARETELSLTADRIVAYVSCDVELPSGHRVGDVIDWTIEAYVLLPTTDGHAYFQLAEDLWYRDLPRGNE